ncbi:MAG: hypothetical protein CL663_07160 [Bacteroidetes bacterium]|nr:hypothetical protein [Bacteroidota bacterium]
MKKFFLVVCALMVFAIIADAQNVDKETNVRIDSSAKYLDRINIANSLLDRDDARLKIGGYGEVNYNQPYGGDIRSNGELDVQRFITFLAYRFSDRVDFVAEIEFEHVKEVYLEQAFIRYRLTDFMNLNAGLMLIPMGIINEYHESTTFNGVERPRIANKIVPTTWREIGAGISGKFQDAGFKYQLYLVNGLKGYDNGSAKINGGGVRSGRQKGAESIMSSPNLSFKFDYYAIRNLNIGFAGYLGKTQSTMFDGLDTTDDFLVAQADSSRVGMKMFGLDARYNQSGFSFRGSYIFGSLSNTKEYNAFTGSNAGSKFYGYYAEVAYDLFRLFEVKTEDQALVAFVRYEKYNTQSDVEGGTSQLDKYNLHDIVTGLGYKIADGVVLKADLQFRKAKDADKYSKQFNAGLAVWF